MTYLTAAGLVITAAILFGLQPVYGLMLKGASVDVTGLMLIRFAVPAMAVLAWVVIKRPPMPWRACVKHASMGLAFAITGIGYYQAGYRIGFSLAVLLFYAFPLMITLYSVVVLRIALGRTQVIAVLAASAGLVLATDIESIKASSSIAWDGIAWALLAAASYAYILTYKSHYAPPLNEAASLLMLTLGATITTAGVAAINGASLPSGGYEWQWSLTLAIFAGLIPIALIMLGAPRAGATDTATCCLIEPVVAVMVAVLLMGEPISVATLLGGGIIVASAVVLVRARHQQSPTGNRKATRLA
ncbi:MAG: DMT family transporter [Litorivicinus sp.]